MAKQYGTVKVDFIACTSGTAGNETDVTIDVSGLSSISQSGITVTGDIIANDITATGTFSGTLAGTATNATTATNCTRSVVAGNGLTGGGQLTANRTVNVGAGDGISVAANTVDVDATVVRTTGNQTIAGTKTFSSTIAGSINGNAATATDCSRSVVAGSGLTGGGQLNANRTVNVGAGDGISVAADTVAVDSTVVRTTGNQTIAGTKTFSSTIAGSINGNAATATSATNATNATTATNCSRSVVAGSGLTGGGQLNANRTVNVGAGDGISVAADTVAVNSTVVRTTGNQTIAGTKTFSSTIAGSINGSAATATTATNCTRSVVAGNGLTGGGQLTANRTVNVGAGDGISVAADTVAVDSTVVRTTGNQTIAGTKTFSSTIVGSINGNAATATNAQTLDNIDSSQFLRSDANDFKTNGYLRFNDNIQLQIGSDADVQFFYNNADFYIDLNTAGDTFNIRNNSDSLIFQVNSAGSVQTGNLFPLTDNTGVVGNSSLTWNGGRFTNLDIDSTLNVRGAIDLADSDQLRFGSGDDILMFYNGADFYIDMQAASDNIYIRNSSDAIVWRCSSGGEVRYAGDIVPDTDNTGNVGTTALTWNNGQFSNLTVNGTLNVRAAIDLADSDILRFGSSDDVEFFFNGSHFYLDLNSGGNNFYIRDGTTVRFTFDDAGDFIATRTVEAKNFKENVYTIGWSSGFALNPLNGETQFVVLGGNSTPTQSSWDNGESITLHIDDGSARTITWTTLGVVWTGGSAPTLATTGDTVIQFWKAGNVIYGALVGEVA